MVGEGNQDQVGKENRSMCGQMGSPQSPPVNRQNDRQTHMTENITFPQLSLRAVAILLGISRESTPQNRVEISSRSRNLVLLSEFPCRSHVFAIDLLLRMPCSQVVKLTRKRNYVFKCAPFLCVYAT